MEGQLYLTSSILSIDTFNQPLEQGIISKEIRPETETMPGRALERSIIHDGRTISSL